MTDNVTQCRIVLAEELPQPVQGARETNFDNLMIGDESWFDYEYPHDPPWTPSRDPLQARASKKLRTKNARCT
jgi:hypothetical protein